jgi:hypothetical protein
MVPGAEISAVDLSRSALQGLGVVAIAEAFLFVSLRDGSCIVESSRLTPLCSMLTL